MSDTSLKYKCWSHGVYQIELIVVINYVLCCSSRSENHKIFYRRKNEKKVCWKGSSQSLKGRRGKSKTFLFFDFLLPPRIFFLLPMLFEIILDWCSQESERETPILGTHYAPCPIVPQTDLLGLSSSQEPGSRENPDLLGLSQQRPDVPKSTQESDLLGLSFHGSFYEFHWRSIPNFHSKGIVIVSLQYAKTPNATIDRVTVFIVNETAQQNHVFSRLECR